MIAVQTFAAPAEEPVSLDEAKARLRITVADEDSDVEALIAEARALAEAECQRAFVTQTLVLTLDDFPRGADRTIYLPRPPLASVTHVKYYDTAGVQQTYSSASYHVATGGEPGRIVPVTNGVWPEVQVGRPEAVEVRYVAGYGPAASVPAGVRAAILVIAAAARENPAGDDNTIVRGGIPAAAKRLLDGLQYGQVW